MRIPVISILAVTVLLAGCAVSPETEQRKADVANLPKCFSVLESLDVLAYRNQDWCKNIWYRRGKFSHQTDPADTCNLFPGTPQPFDAPALTDFESVTAAVATTGVRLYYISDLAYDARGKLNHAEFHLAAGQYTYVYSPGYRKLPEDMPRERKHSRIDQDWYYIWEDWN
jgi:hypothetical protein